MKKILVTNDDGLYSAGLMASYRALKKLGKVFIVAPTMQRSGVGRSISIMEPIRVGEVSLNGIKAYAVDGTPTDAVIIGIYEIIGDLPDLVVSGINLGENLSTEAITTSGTVGAALEAATQGAPAIAISLEMHNQDKFDFVFKPYDFSVAEEILQEISRKILKNGMPKGVDLFNINVPKNWNNEIEFTRLARRMYKTRIDARFDPRGRRYYWIDGKEIEDAEIGTDIHALRNGKVSITPISLDSTARVEFDELKRWYVEG